MASGDNNEVDESLNSRSEKKQDIASEKQLSKVDLFLKSAGDAPIMSKRKWAVEMNKTVADVSQFIKTYLKLEANDSLFLYVNQAFAPAPDELIRNLYDCFGSEGKLVIHYAKSQAWG